MASFPKPPSADDTVEMNRMPDFDELETLVADVRKGSDSPDATLRMPALSLSEALKLPEAPPPSTAPLKLPAPPPSAPPAKPGNETRLRPAVKLDALTRLRPGTTEDSPVPAPQRSTARMRAPLDSLPRTIMDFGGEKGSVAPVAMPTFDAPSTPSAWPSATKYHLPRRTWPLTMITLVAVFASFVTLGAAIVAAWGDEAPGLAHAAASALVLPARAAPSAASPLQPLSPSSASARAPASTPPSAPHTRSGPAKPVQVSDNPYEDVPAAPSPPPVTAPTPPPADGKDGADKKLEDLVRSLQRD